MYARLLNLGGRGPPVEPPLIGEYSPSYDQLQFRYYYVPKLDISQWFKADPLPKACCDVSSVAIGKVIYALGGYKHPLSIPTNLSETKAGLLV